MSGSARWASGARSPGRPDAPLLRDDRVDAELEEGADPVDEQRPAARVAQRQRVRPQQEHRADHLARERPADACRVRRDEVLLERGRILGRDERRREVAEARRHPVDDLAPLDEGGDDVARLLHPLARVDVERGAHPVAGDRLHVRDREVGAGQDDEVVPVRRSRPRWYEMGIGHGSEHRLPFRPCSTS